MSPKLKPVIWIVSIVVPLVVATLLNPSFRDAIGGQLDLGFDASILATINAAINGTVSILLVTGFLLIRRGNREAHKKVMLSAFTLSALFLVTYVLYHLSHGEKHFAGEGAVRGVYFFILISHIVLSAFVIPLSSFSIFHALSNAIPNHRKLAKITFPLWLYVAVTGVVVYVMNSILYP